MFGVVGGHLVGLVDGDCTEDTSSEDEAPDLEQLQFVATATPVNRRMERLREIMERQKMTGEGVRGCGGRGGRGKEGGGGGGR
jgi:hypothetical protein